MSNKAKFINCLQTILVEKSKELKKINDNINDSLSNTRDNKYLLELNTIVVNHNMKLVTLYLIINTIFKRIISDDYSDIKISEPNSHFRAIFIEDIKITINLITCIIIITTNISIKYRFEYDFKHNTLLENCI